MGRNIPHWKFWSACCTLQGRECINASQYRQALVTFACLACFVSIVVVEPWFWSSICFLVEGWFTLAAFMLYTCWYACIVYLCARRALRLFKQFILGFFSYRACRLGLLMLTIPSMWSCCFWQEREERRKRLKREQQDGGSRLHSQQIRNDYAPQPKRHSRFKEAPQGTKYWAIFWIVWVTDTFHIVFPVLIHYSFLPLCFFLCGFYI